MSDQDTQQQKKPLSELSGDELLLHLNSVREVAQSLSSVNTEGMTPAQLEQRDTMLREATQLLGQLAMEQLRRLLGGIGQKLQALIAQASAQPAGHSTQEKDQGGPHHDEHL